MFSIPPNEHLIETKICKKCSVSFPITDKDMEFYDKVSPSFRTGSGILGDSEINSEGQKVKKYQIPPPTLCPDCRQQRRQAIKNILYLYKNEMKNFISAISPDKNLNVVLQKEWWENPGLGLEFGRDFDFSRGFFEQFHDLQKVAPRWNLIQIGSENCDWCINVSESKNCYYIKSGGNVEDCYYGVRTFDSKNVLDSFEAANNCENCYDVYYISGCYNVFYSWVVRDSKESLYLNNCENVSYCIGCVGIRNKSYHILNKPVTKETFAKYKQEILTSRESRKKFIIGFQALVNTIPVKPVVVENSEDYFGNEIFNSKNAHYCFGVRDGQDMKYAFDGAKANKVMDVNGQDTGEFSYETSSNFGINSSAFCFNSVTLNNCYYCETGANLSHCFACVGLNQKSYCILNKQYTRKEYETLVPKIITYMQKTKEWGEFFPAKMSPYGYNESEAQEWFILSKDDALSQGFNWSDYEAPFPKVEKVIPANLLPDSIESIPDDILNWAIECEVTKKPFRIIKQELEFYRKHNLPIPRRHPDQRHLDRMALRNPRKLYERKCDKCRKDMITTYAPERPEIVYCEECYNREVVG